MKCKERYIQNKTRRGTKKRYAKDTLELLLQKTGGTVSGIHTQVLNDYEYEKKSIRIAYQSKRENEITSNVIKM